MATGPKRRRLAKSGDASSEGPSSRAYSQDPSAPATNEERSRWKGFCEIESEPVSPAEIPNITQPDLLQAFFNVMLRDFGVEGVRVQEVVSLDPDMLAYLPYDPLRVIFRHRTLRFPPAAPFMVLSSCSNGGRRTQISRNQAAPKEFGSQIRYYLIYFFPVGSC